MALPDTIQLTGATARTSGINGVNLVAGSNYLGASIDNSANLDAYAVITVAYALASAPTADKVLEIYILYSNDGTNYEDGAGDGTGSGDVDPKAPLVGVVPVYADTSTHRMFLRNIPLLPLRFKVLVKSEVDQNMAASSLVLAVQTYNQKVVD